MRLPLVLLEDNTLGATTTRTPDTTRRCQENEAARILIGIVVVFIFCHAARVISDFYEMIYIENITACHSIGKNGVHSWVLAVNEISGAMITLNSSVNMIIYGLIKPNIRKHIFRCENSRTQENQSNGGGDHLEMEQLEATAGITIPTG